MVAGPGLTALLRSRLGFRQFHAWDSYPAVEADPEIQRGQKIRAANLRERSASHWPRCRCRSGFPAPTLQRALRRRHCGLGCGRQPPPGERWPLSLTSVPPGETRVREAAEILFPAGCQQSRKPFYEQQCCVTRLTDKLGPPARESRRDRLSQAATCWLMSVRRLVMAPRLPLSGCENARPHSGQRRWPGGSDVQPHHGKC